MSLALLLRKARSVGRLILRRLSREPTWRGVYERFADVPVRGGYEADLWITGTTQGVRAAIRNSAKLEGDRVLLAFLVATQSRGSARILDFGGGMGLDFVLLRNTLGAAAIAEYAVVDVPRVVEAGRQLVPEVRFSSELPEPASSFDLVYGRSALQYVPDPFATLRRLLSYGAPYVLLLDVPAGDVPTFVTAQLNVPGSVLAYWFLNIEQVERTVIDAGYAVVLRTPADRRSVRIDAPAEYRLPHASNLVLRRTA